MAQAANRAGNLSHTEILALAEKIVRSPTFAHSERLSRFLRLAVERTLAGETAQLKEYSLGRDVFDRPEEYDPRVDSIVRVEARRLRAKLRQYYEKYGLEDPIAIAFPRGGYVPEFHERTPEAPAETAPAAALDPYTVAVLPFLDLAPDRDREFLCYGLAEQIINRLAACPRLKVIARTSSFSFKNKSLDIREIGSRLGAGTVVEGSVRQAGEQLRVSAAVIDAATGRSLWSETYDRGVTDVFAVEQEIAEHIAKALRVKVDAARKASPTAPNAGPEAYTLYLKGQHAWSQANPPGLRAAIEHFSRANSLYPDYAPPYAGLADSYLGLSLWGGMHPATALPRSMRAALEALRLDPGLSRAYAALGMAISRYQWDWDGATRLLSKALDLEPHNVEAGFLNSWCLWPLGKFDETLQGLNRVLEVDPLSLRANRSIGLTHYFHRNYEQAVRWFHRSLEFGDDTEAPHFFLAQTYLRLNRLDDALREARLCDTVPPKPIGLGVLGEVLGRCGKAAEARAILRRFDAIQREEYVEPVSYAVVYGGLGDWDSVLQWLDRAVNEHSMWVPFSACDPRYDPIRGEARFQELLARMKLA